jgi:archaellum component FlaC
MEVLKEDLRRNKDANKLEKLGSIKELPIATGACPTCHQQVSSLLPHETSELTMSIEENITFIENQLVTFRLMRINSARALEAKEKQLFSLKSEIDEIRSQIRAIKKTLNSDDRIPSIAALRELVALEERIRLGEKIEDEFDLCLDKFSDLVSEWKSIRERFLQLPKEGLSQSDKKKLELLQRLFIEQINQYGFSSVPPESLEISTNNYRPTREGFNLGFDISASDNIRMIWAYLLALLELSNEVQTNHLGLLILDEPRQQEAKELSFAELLKRASNSINFEQQVLFATSETDNVLNQILSDIPHKYHNFTGKIIKKLDE